MNFILIILAISIYWILFYSILTIILERNKKSITFNFKQNRFLESKLSYLKKFKHFLPSISKFNKTNIESTEFDYLHAFNEELSKAFLIHSLPFLGTIPFIFLNINAFIINFIFIFIFNIFFIMIIYYNKLRLQRLITLREKNENSKNYSK